MRPRSALAALGLALLAGGCVVPGTPGAPRSAASLSELFGGTDVSYALQGTGRNVGHVANLALRNHGVAPARVVIPAGWIVEPGDGPPSPRVNPFWMFQRYGLFRSASADLAPGESRTIGLAGVCLEPERAVWPAGTWMPGARILSTREWASRRPGASPENPDLRALVALRAVTPGPFAAAKKDPSYVQPAIPWADDAVRQWAVWGTIGGKTKSDLSQAMDREAPQVPPVQRAVAVEQVWAAARVVVEKGGAAASAEEQIDWAALDLTLK